MIGNETTAGDVRSSMIPKTPRRTRHGRYATAVLGLAAALAAAGCGAADDEVVVPSSTAPSAGSENALPTMETAEALVGLDLDTAIAEATVRGWEVRVMRLDGEDQLGTADYVIERVNVAVDDDVVTGILSIG